MNRKTANIRLTTVCLAVRPSRGCVGSRLILISRKVNEYFLKNICFIGLFVNSCSFYVMAAAPYCWCTVCGMVFAALIGNMYFCER